MTVKTVRLERLQPGDKVLIVFDVGVRENDAQEIMEDLRSDFSGVTFSGIVGASHVLVHPAPIEVKSPEVDPDELRIHVQSKQPRECQHIWPEVLHANSTCGVCKLPYDEWVDGLGGGS